MEDGGTLWEVRDVRDEASNGEKPFAEVDSKAAPNNKQNFMVSASLSLFLSIA